jgi:hypothetical protein
MGMSMTEDPNELLARLRMLAANTHASDPVSGRGMSEEIRALHHDLALTFQALDAHLSGGGDVPAAWDRWEQAKLSVLSNYEPVEVEPLGGPEPGVNGSHLPEDEEQPDES